MEVLSEVDFGSSVESFKKLVDSQRELFHCQIDELQRLVVAQCKLTGANPLSQEMAAGALSINIGKRPRDLLNPKAIKYMQSVFSVKDAITKKESRELSAQFGVSVSQVREFFNTQRTKVRRIVQLSREKAIRSTEHNNLLEGLLASSDPLIAIDPLPLNTVGPSNVEDAPFCSTQDETLSVLDDFDKHFVENVFNLMRKEETFSGQVEVLELILRIQNPSVLCWFLTKGGVMILVTWLTQAADEEQTSVLLVILKVLCHLPLQKAVPVHMSAILQSVNRLRFYRTSDISNRARVLLARWSKSLARSQAMKKTNGIKTSTDSQELALLKRSIDEAICDDPWNSNCDAPEDMLALTYDSADRSGKLEASEPMKLLTASSDDSNKKQILGVSSSQRGRRKIQLVEQPGQKAAGRSSQAARATPVSQARPMSVDDIQKAKLRAQYMQSKYGKSGSSNENKELKVEGVNKVTVSQASSLPVASHVPHRSNIEESKKPVTPPLKERENLDISVQPSGSFESIGSFQSNAPKLKMDIKEHFWEKCRRVQVPWKTPPEIKLNLEWGVCSDDNGKEMEVQKNRNHREQETIYKTLKEIPPNPKEPWDIEMDYDDSLTPVIPIEQPPDTDGTEIQGSLDNNRVEPSVVPSEGVTASAQTNNATTTAEPDLELLAVLLKNPELVFALTSGQAGNLSSEDTVKLLDMIKAGGGGFAGNLNGLASKMEEKVEVSLPSPTPSSSPGTGGWRPEATRYVWSQQGSVQNRVSPVYTSPVMAANNDLVPSQSSTTAVQNRVSPVYTSSPHSPRPQRLSSSQQAVPAYSPEQIHQNTHTTTLPSHLHHNYSNMAVPSVWGESTSNGKPAASYNSYSVAAERQPTSLPSPFLSTFTHQQRHLPQPSQQPHYSESHHYSESAYFSKPPIGKPPGSSLSDSWRAGRRGPPSNYQYLDNQTQYYNAPQSYGGGPLHQQPPLRSGPHEGNEYVHNGGGGFESWSPPQDSPARNTEYNMYGRNAYLPADRSRQSSTQSPGYRDYSRQGHRWPDRGRH